MTEREAVARWIMRREEGVTAIWESHDSWDRDEWLAEADDILCAVSSAEPPGPVTPDDVRTLYQQMQHEEAQAANFVLERGADSARAGLHRNRAESFRRALAAFRASGVEVPS